MRSLRNFLILALLSWPTGAVAQPMQQETGSRPVPDPTTLTNLALDRAIAGIRELFDTKIAALRDEVAQQKKTLDASDARLVQRLDAVPVTIDVQIAHIQALTNEKFASIEKQFRERDDRAVQVATSSKAAIDTQNLNNAALFAELKSGFAASIKSIQENQATEIKNLNTQVSQIKDLQTASDNRSVGIGSSWAIFIAAIGALGVIGGLFIAFRRPEKEIPPAQVVYVPTPATLPTTEVGRK